MEKKEPLYYHPSARLTRRLTRQGHEGQAGQAVPPPNPHPLPYRHGAHAHPPPRPLSQPPPEAPSLLPQRSKPSSVAMYTRNPNRVERVRVLLLTFEYHDLRPGLDEETTRVRRAFESLWGHDGVVSEFTIPMRDYRTELRQRLGEFLPSQGQIEIGLDTLYVVYYHGHGGRNAEGKFTLFSHDFPRSLGEHLMDFWYDIEEARVAAARRVQTMADWTRLPSGVAANYERLQPRAQIVWDRDVNDLIMDADCDTLTILDCCDAGLAAVNDEYLYNLDFETNPRDLRGDFRKELLGACSWGNETFEHMSPSLVKVLTRARDLWLPSDVISVSTLVRMMNIDLAGTEDVQVVPQAVHYNLRRTVRDPIVLPRLVPRPQE